MVGSLLTLQFEPQVLSPMFGGLALSSLAGYCQHSLGTGMSPIVL